MGTPRFTAHEAVTVAGTAIGFTAATMAGSEFAVVTVETAAVRYSLDSTAPTTTTGHSLEVGDVLQLDNREQLANFKAIRRDGVSATLHCTYGR